MWGRKFHLEERKGGPKTEEEEEIFYSTKLVRVCRSRMVKRLVFSTGKEIPVVKTAMRGSQTLP